MAVVFKNIAFIGDAPTAHTLDSHSTRAHSELSDAPEGAHHTKYSDANARSAVVEDAAYGAGWNGVTTVAASKNAVYDKIETLGAATKEFFVQAQQRADIPPTSDDRGVLINGGTDSGIVIFLVPQDYNSLTSAEAILVIGSTGASMHFTISTRWGAYNSESWTTHSELVFNVDMGATTFDRNFALDISGWLNVAPLARGDIVSVAIIYSGTSISSNFYFRGLRFKYT